MDLTLQTLMQYISDPADLADSLSAYFSRRCEKLDPTVDKLSRVIDETMSVPDFIADEGIVHKCAIEFDDDINEMRYIDIDNVARAIHDNINDKSADPLIAVYDKSGEIQRTISLDEAISRVREQSAQMDMLNVSLKIAQQHIDAGSDDMFLLNSLSKIEGYLQDTDLSTRLKGIFTAVSEEISDNLHDPAALVESILCHFGLTGNANDPRRNDASLYTGQSARATLFTAAADKIGWTISQLPSIGYYVTGLCATIVAGIVKLFENTYKGLQTIAMNTIIKAFELDDGIRKTTLPGKGTIEHPGFAMQFDDTATSYPGGSIMADVFTALKTSIGSTSSENHQFTVPCGPAIVYLNWLGDKAQITYDIKPINYKVYQQVFYEHFGDYPYLHIKAQGGVITSDNSGIDLSGLSRSNLLNFITDLYSRNNLWGMDFKMDSDRYMCIQASRHLISIIYVLSDSTIDIVNSAVANDLENAWVRFDITAEHGYNVQTQAFIPENINFASLCTMIVTRQGKKVDCFSSYLDDTNTLNLSDGSSYTWLSAINVGAFHYIGLIVANIIGNDPELSGNFFVPYFHKFKKYRPSYYIPTDTENYQALKRMIITGFVVVAVIAVTAITVKLYTKFRRKTWEMQQIAAQKAFTASERGDVALLNEGWKMQKKANLLANLTGATQLAVTPITNGVTTLYKSMATGDVSYPNLSFESLSKLIRG